MKYFEQRHFWLYWKQCNRIECYKIKIVDLRRIPKPTITNEESANDPNQKTMHLKTPGSFRKSIP